MKKALMVFALVICALVWVLTGCGNGEKTQSSLSSAHPVSGGSEFKGKVLVVVPDRDYQDVEYDAVRTFLGRAGYEVVVANSTGGTSTGLSGRRVQADVKIGKADAADYRGIVLIGGPGAEAYADMPDLRGLVRHMARSDRVVSAICIAPVILANAGVLEGRMATVWPDRADRIAQRGARYVNEPVVVDGKIVTGDGPGSAEQFAQAVVKALGGE